MTNYKLKSWEYRLALIIAKFLVVIIAIIFYWFRLLFITLYKSKRAIYKLAIILLIIRGSLAVMTPIVYAPKAEAMFTYSTQNQQIIDYIHTVFGKDADNFLKILSCENHKLKWDAQNYNSDGSVDIGIAQINSIHGIPAKYLYNWRLNVDAAYSIFKDSGFGAWTCSYLLK